jgi:hypothetical protein
MPYKNPEDKRRWETEHREQRNEQRRAQRLGAVSRPVVLNSAPDPDQESRNGWRLLIVLAIGFGSILLGAITGARLPKAN